MSTFELVVAVAYPIILAIAGYSIGLLHHIRKQVAQLYVWHDVPDTRRPGGMAWYSHDHEIVEELRALREVLEELRDQGRGRAWNQGGGTPTPPG